jgi:RNA polymerase sigma-70 factor (ECF subfamily)
MRRRDHAPILDRVDPQAKDRATALLRAAQCGEGGGEKLFELLYAELKGVAGGLLSVERPGHTLQPTALVHEAWVRLIDAREIGAHGRGQFLCIAAKVMRRILVEHARARARLKRGGGWRRIEIQSTAESAAASDEDLLAVDGVLEELAGLSERQARIVELRFFSGLSVEETALAANISMRTVEREWRFARAWLSERLADRSTD